MGKKDDDLGKYDGDVRDLFRQTRSLVESRLGVKYTMDQVVEDVIDMHTMEWFRIMDEMEVSMCALAYVRFMCAADLSLPEDDLIEQAQTIITGGQESAKKVRGLLVNTANLIEDIFRRGGVENVPDYGDKLLTMIAGFGFIGQANVYNALNNDGNVDVVVVDIVSNIYRMVKEIVVRSPQLDNLVANAAQKVMDLIHDDALEYLSKIVSYNVDHSASMVGESISYHRFYDEIVREVEEERLGKIKNDDTKMRVISAALMAMMIGMGKRNDFIRFAMRINASISKMGDVIFSVGSEGRDLDWRDSEVGAKVMANVLSKFTAKMNEDVDDETAKKIDLTRLINDLRSGNYGKG